MNLARVRAWDWLVGLLGIALIALMGIDWYEFPEGGRSAYDAFAITDVLLVVLGLIAASVVVVTAAAARPARPLAPLAVTAAAGVLLTLLVGYRLLNQPGRNADVGIAAGGWLGLACMLALVYVAYRALRDQRAPGLEPTPEPQRMPAPQLVEPAHEPPSSPT